MDTDDRCEVAGARRGSIDPDLDQGGAFSPWFPSLLVGQTYSPSVSGPCRSKGARAKQCDAAEAACWASGTVVPCAIHERTSGSRSRMPQSGHSALGPRRPCGGTDANTSRTVGADGCVPLQKPRTPGFSQVRHPRRARRCASGRAEDTPGTPPCETAPAPAHTGTRSPPGRHGGRGSPAPRNPRRP